MRTHVAAVALGIVIALGAVHVFGQGGQSLASDSRCFELRIYTAAPGKLQNLHALFRDHDTAFFKKYGMTVVGYWVPNDKPDTFIYILAHPSRAAADAAWKKLRDDPDHAAVRKATDADGPLTLKVESIFMSATDYSPMK